MTRLILILLLFFYDSFANQNSIKFMSFNIRVGTANDGENHWDKRKDMVCKVIREHEVDILGLQEAVRFQTDHILSQFNQYQSVGHSRDGKGLLKGEGCNILFDQNKFKLLKEHTFWLSETPETLSKSWGSRYYRICTYALFEKTSNQQKFYVYNTHFSHISELSQEKSMLLIEKTIRHREENHPFVLMGDFNSLPHSPQIKFWDGQELHGHKTNLKLLDTFSQIHKNSENISTCNNFKFNDYNKKDKIDYLFIEKNDANIISADIIRYSENNRYPSDHFPIISEIIFTKS